MRFLFRKGAVEAILYLHRVGRAGYYEMLKQGFVVSRETFSILIRELERGGHRGEEAHRLPPPEGGVQPHRQGEGGGGGPEQAGRDPAGRVEGRIPRYGHGTPVS
jgi:hypothetical protein